MNGHSYFSPDYLTARSRFREAAEALGWQSETHALDATAPGVDQLTIDVAISPGHHAEQTLVLSSGVHGVEGFFGSAVQLALLQQWRDGTLPEPKARVVMLHALNPWGMAALRRFNEENIDLNRNFLLPSEAYAGAPEKYVALQGLLNPERPPPRVDLFPLQAMLAVARFGLPALMQAIAAGQYEYPRGLFFGGKGPSATHALLMHQMPRWLSGSREVVHLDFHTGLGKSGEYKLLIDYPLHAREREQLTTWFGADAFTAHETGAAAYTARGGFGQWCVGHHFAPHYLFATAEFGTYPPAKILAALRLENQAHHYAQPQAANTMQIKRRLLEMFCPAAVSWREGVIAQSVELVSRSLNGLTERAVST
jgi:hypothetical protein